MPGPFWLAPLSLPVLYYEPAERPESLGIALVVEGVFELFV